MHASKFISHCVAFVCVFVRVRAYEREIILYEQQMPFQCNMYNVLIVFYLVMTLFKTLSAHRKVISSYRKN